MKQFSIPNWTTLILVLLLIVIQVFKPFDQQPKSILSPPKQKHVIDRMQPIENQVHFHQTKADNLRPVINALALKYDSLIIELKKAKASKDTVRIIQYYDQALTEKEFQTEKLENLVSELDSVNLGLRYLSSSKDTLLALKDLSLKKVKRQRNISLLVNGVLGTIMFLK